MLYDTTNCKRKGSPHPYWSSSCSRWIPECTWCECQKPVQKISGYIQPWRHKSGRWGMLQQISSIFCCKWRLELLSYSSTILSTSQEPKRYWSHQRSTCKIYRYSLSIIQGRNVPQLFTCSSCYNIYEQTDFFHWDWRSREFFHTCLLSFFPW